MTDQNTELDDVKRVVRRWAKSFSLLNADQIMAIWDSAYPKTIHQAEEFPDPIRGYEDITHYNETMVKLVSNPRDQTLIDMEADVIGDMAWVYIRGTITFDIPSMPNPVSGQTRQTFILRKVNEEWKFIHYHESRETPDFRQYFYEAHPNGEKLRKQDEEGRDQHGENS